MEWNGATITAVGGAIAVVIGAIVAGFIKISEIHKIVNSRDTALRAELNTGKSEIESLKLMVQALTRDKGVVSAIQFDPKCYYEALEFIGREKADKTDPEDSIMVEVEGVFQEACAGDWIVKSVEGHSGDDPIYGYEVYADELFHRWYEKAEAES